MPLVSTPSSLLADRRVEFDLDEFTQGIKDHGYDVTWSKALMCPNRDPKQEDHHRLNCQVCDHAGFVYYDPIATKVEVTSYGLKQQFLPESRYEPGTAYFTFLPEFRPSFWDMIQLDKARARFTQVVKTKTGQLVYPLKYPVLEVSSVVLTNSSFVVDASVSAGNLLFAAPPASDFFSVSYFYRPRYIILDMLHNIRSSRLTFRSEDRESEFPLQVMARLDFLVRDESQNA